MATTVQLVVTPGSGDGRALAIARAVRRELIRQGYAPRMQLFGTLPSLIRWAKRCPADFSYLVAIGGDATMSAAAEAAVRLAVPYLPVPSGFGNLFTGTFEHPNDPAAIVELLGGGDVVSCDVGVAPSGTFLSHTSYGFLSSIQEDVEKVRRQPRQRALRMLAYYRTAAGRLSKSLDSIELEIDGTPVPGKAALVTIANVETYRGFLNLTPAASPADGLFDVCVIPRTTPARVLSQLVQVMIDAPGARDELTVFRGRAVRVRVNRRKPEDIRILAGALPLLAPAGALDRLQARQIAMQADAPVTTPTLHAPAASASAPAAARERRERSTPPAEVA